MVDLIILQMPFIEIIWIKHIECIELITILILTYTCSLI